MAATMGYERVTAIAHQSESLLGALRDGSIGVAPATIDLLVRAVDALTAAVALAPVEAPGDPSLDAELAAALTPGGATPVAVGRATAARPALEADDVVRLPRERLDHMVRLASELLVTRTRLDARAAIVGDPMLEELSAATGRAARSLHDELLDARLVAVGELFERFPRVVRDLARGLGKDVELVSSGDDLELDRAVLEALAEPLVHLLRNAIDHGIEAPEVRERAGKPRAGRIRLTAMRGRDQAIVTLADDGRGIDRAKVAARAARDGILTPADQMDDGALLALIARPGFSTAERVSDVSGRGVGVDAVVSAVRRLGGAVTLSSTPGQGTVWTLGLPMRLTVVRALLAQAGAMRLAIPFAMIAETALLPTDTRTESGAVTVRGESLALRDFTRLTGQATEVWAGRRRPAIVLDVNGRRSALAVDALLGQQEIVMERFEAPAGLAAYIGGATVLADGHPALVLAATAIDEGGA
jgi:two-component system chemotaxis sensor kinase CheA